MGTWTVNALIAHLSKLPPTSLIWVDYLPEQDIREAITLGYVVPESNEDTMGQLVQRVMNGMARDAAGADIDQLIDDVCGEEGLTPHAAERVSETRWLVTEGEDDSIIAHSLYKHEPPKLNVRDKWIAVFTVYGLDWNEPPESYEVVVDRTGNPLTFDQYADGTMGVSPAHVRRVLELDSPDDFFRVNDTDSPGRRWVNVVIDKDGNFLRQENA